LRLAEYVHDQERPELLAQWDVRRNLPLSPDVIGTGSSLKVWWQCERGHSWKATVTSRVSMGRGCPYCTGKLAILGETDLVTVFPDIAAQWHPTKNRHLRPEQVTSGSEKSVWWQCGRGHEWKSLVRLRANKGHGCPYCAGQWVIPGETDLATRYPEVAQRWHPVKNGDATPSQILPRTHRRYWWMCEKGHEWQVSPSALIQGSGCPCCAGKKVIPGETDLTTLRPDLAAQWHPAKNGKLTPEDVSPGSEKRVWWLCERGHDYQSVVFSRADGTGCPYCAGKKVWPGFNDLGTLYPHLAMQWHDTLNGSLTSRDVTKGSHRMVWWECREGHVWKAAVFSRTRKNASGCPVCAGVVRKKKTDQAG